MTILDRVEASLASFRPGTPAEFVALQLSRRFDDVHRLPRYITAARRHTKQELLLAAKTAIFRHELNRMPTADLFFEALTEQEKGSVS
jgi:hypothetical protein